MNWTDHDAPSSSQKARQHRSALVFLDRFSSMDWTNVKLLGECKCPDLLLVSMWQSRMVLAVLREQWCWEDSFSVIREGPDPGVRTCGDLGYACYQGRAHRAGGWDSGSVFFYLPASFFPIFLACGLVSWEPALEFTEIKGNICSAGSTGWIGPFGGSACNPSQALKRDFLSACLSPFIVLGQCHRWI